ncbi:MAG: MFS transporter [Alphaproteobacteria bacterium]|nr:MFS transporter [Alphaproteobacteria bacterium]
MHGMLGMTGFRLFNAPTFLPAYLHMISGSTAVVGLGQALQQLGGIFSPIVGATQIEHRKRVLPVAVAMGIAMRLQILGIALSGFVLEGAPLLAAVLLFLFLFGIFSGAQSVAFQMLLAKVIPVARRGRLQALRNVTGGAIAAVLAWAAGRYFIAENLFGNGYGVTFLLAVGLTSLGLTALRVLMHEPEPPTVRAKSTLRARAKDFPALLRGDRGFMWFMIAQTCAVAGRIAAPFYVLHASATIELTGETLGYISLAYLGADVATNLAWGMAGDRFGFRAAFIAALALWIGATGLLIGAEGLGPILAAFFGLGAAASGLLMSTQTMVLEFGGREDVAMRLALSTTAQGLVSTIGPLAGGVLAARFGYVALFWVSIAFEAAALGLLVTLVEEPRRRRR